MGRKHLTLAAWLVQLAAIPALAETATGPDLPAGDAEYGAYLSNECTGCHRLDGTDEGIPSIVGWPEEAFFLTMQSYRSGDREHQVMNMIAGRLDDEEMAALAAYFAAVED